MKRLIVAILICVFLAGMFDACMDIRRDNVPTFLSGWFGDWYVGGNYDYTLPIWGPYDFWHFSKSCLMACWSAIAALSLVKGQRVFVRWYDAVGLFLALYWIEGLTFSLFYHVVWRL